MTEGFWSARPVLGHVLQVARARGVGPWALLGAALARAVATIPPEVVLPGIVGSRMSLNLFVALVGPSGGGKGAAEAAAIDAFKFADFIATVPLGSGEGIARTFRPVGASPGDFVTTAVFTTPEIDTLAVLAGRQGSSLSAELRKMYSGEQLGFANAGKDTRVIVEANSYRACLSIGVQPLRSQTLLAAADGGLPQRFLWLPTSDPGAPDEPPRDPNPWPVKRPSWLRLAGEVVELVVPDVAREAIRSHRLAVLREDPSVDPLDGHALLTRLKIAVALMALEGRSVVDNADWSLAGYLMDVSDNTRQRCQRALVEQSRSVNTARALAAAERGEIVSERRHQRCKDSILRWVARLPENGTISRQQLTRSIKSDVRDCFDAAIGELITEGRITAVQTPRGIAYRGPTLDYRSNPPEQPKHGLDQGPTLDQKQSRRRQRTRGRYRPSRQTGSEASA